MLYRYMPVFLLLRRLLLNISNTRIRVLEQLLSSTQQWEAIKKQNEKGCFRKCAQSESRNVDVVVEKDGGPGPRGKNVNDSFSLSKSMTSSVGGATGGTARRGRGRKSGGAEAERIYIEPGAEYLVRLEAEAGFYNM